MTARGFFGPKISDRNNEVVEFMVELTLPVGKRCATSARAAAKETNLWGDRKPGFHCNTVVLTGDTVH